MQSIHFSLIQILRCLKSSKFKTKIFRRIYSSTSKRENISLILRWTVPLRVQLFNVLLKLTKPENTGDTLYFCEFYFRFLSEKHQLWDKTWNLFVVQCLLSNWWRALIGSLNNSNQIKPTWTAAFNKTAE